MKPTPPPVTDEPTSTDTASVDGTGTDTGVTAVGEPDGAAETEDDVENTAPQQDPPVFRPLGDCAPGTVLTHRGRPMIVLGRHDDQTEVLLRGDLVLLPAHTRATPIPVAADRETALTRAVAHLGEHLRDLRVQRDQAQARHRRVMDDIRAYAIDCYHEDRIDKEGLAQFLSAFGLAPYDRVQVSFTIHGGYQTTGHPDHAAPDLRAHLRLDLTGIPDLVPDSTFHTLAIDITT
ncbi:MAG: hypothetical protein GXX79_11415 [Actinomycetales bacterium]|nr:hypothetical protein [Actinomycetales bacterium]